VAFLVDGASYYATLADALQRARHAVWLIGWDFHSQLRLRREGSGEGREPGLADRLDSLVRERRGLRIRILAWDFSMLHALERELVPHLQFSVSTRRGIEFELDGDHPVGASQHQKLAVIDDAIAFVGGLDLTERRWDTREHAPEDPRRATSDGERYAPFHDVQLAVDGEAARALGDLARERWRRATGRRVRPGRGGTDAWPEGLTPHVRDARIGIARTQPAHAGRPEVREVERLHLRSILTARRTIYLETQYLTAERVVQALAQRLGEPEGPEVLVVLPRRSSGWLEQQTMDALRARAIQRLRAADRFDRLRIYTPHVPDLEAGEYLYVHSKVMVVDDDLARVGSANLSNRSMGLDSECDLAIDAEGREACRRAIRDFRDGLLAEHLGVEPAKVGEAVGSRGSLLAAVEALRGEGRSLQPLETSEAEWAAEAVREIGVADPEHPLPYEELIAKLGRRGGDAAAGRGESWRRVLVVIGAVIALAALWKMTSLSEWIAPERLSQLAAPLRQGTAGMLMATALFSLASVLLVPVTGLIVAASLTLEPVPALLVCLGGSLVGAAIGHAAGQLFWRDAIRRIAGKRLHSISRRLGRRGVMSTALVRLLPIAPFMVVNLVAGASHVGLRDFLVGTAIGMAPGLLGLVFASRLIVSALTAPSATTLLAALAAVAAGAALMAWLRLLARRTGADG
jgi:phosphatidylserine/phosphatidylglycerophosphate/cardiolipin synthase-like enzyme/uncharacterized membrane protein YdjX (TVP38/TMEM64 family)